MPDGILSVAFKAVMGALRLPVAYRWIWRKWYSRSPDRALCKFRSLVGRVDGLLEQVDEGTVNPAARATLAAELDALSVFPKAIRGERGEAYLGPELEYLRACMNAQEDYLSLPMAQKNMPSTGPLRDPDHLRDTLGAAWDKYFE